MKSYVKQPERVFELTREVTIPVGTRFARAPQGRGGVDAVEGLVGLGRDATLILHLPLRVAEIEAKEWLSEVKEEATSE